jgi:hypothetical protein
MRDKVWTVVGFWYNDEIGISDQGYWAGSFHAPDAKTAEAMAVEAGKPGNYDEAEDPYDPTTDDGTVFHDGLTLPSYGD